VPETRDQGIGLKGSIKKRNRCRVDSAMNHLLRIRRVVVAFVNPRFNRMNIDIWSIYRIRRAVASCVYPRNNSRFNRTNLNNWSMYHKSPPRPRPACRVSSFRLLIPWVNPRFNRIDINNLYMNHTRFNRIKINRLSINHTPRPHLACRRFVCLPEG